MIGAESVILKVGFAEAIDGSGDSRLSLCHSQLPHLFLFVSLCRRSPHSDGERNTLITPGGMPPGIFRQLGMAF